MAITAIEKDTAGTTTTTRIFLATRGDDLGVNHSTNRAFYEAYKHGILRNAGALAPAPAMREAADMLAGEKGLCVGLHSTMTSEWDKLRWGPVADAAKVRSLLRADGTLKQTTMEIWNDGFDIDEIFTELQAQLDRLRALGFDVRYVDDHMGWTWVLKERRERFTRWAEAEGIAIRWIYGRFPDVKIEGDPVERLIARLAAAQPGHYCTVGHPAHDDDEMRMLCHAGNTGDRVARDREWERRIFMDPRIVDYCRGNGVRPVRFDETES